MSDPAKILGDALRAELKKVVREALREELAENSTATDTEEDSLLTPDQAAEFIGVNRRWLYRHAAKLPFTRRISRKSLRFCERGLRAWAAAKKPSSSR